MNIETAAAGYKEALHSAGYAGSQLSLPLDADAGKEAALRAAWRRSGLPIPYHLALRNRPLAICLSCLADAMQERASTRRPDADRTPKRVRADKQSWTRPAAHSAEADAIDWHMLKRIP